ncbi:hypothetical protein ACFL1H_03790 [Nanoarchaeota archaeon]
MKVSKLLKQIGIGCMLGGFALTSANCGAVVSSVINQKKNEVKDDFNYDLVVDGVYVKNVKRDLDRTSSLANNENTINELCSYNTGGYEKIPMNSTRLVIDSMNNLLQNRVGLFNGGVDGNTVIYLVKPEALDNYWSGRYSYDFNRITVVEGIHRSSYVGTLSHEFGHAVGNVRDEFVSQLFELAVPLEMYSRYPEMECNDSYKSKVNNALLNVIRHVNTQGYDHGAWSVINLMYEVDGNYNEAIKRASGNYNHYSTKGSELLNNRKNGNWDQNDIAEFVCDTAKKVIFNNIKGNLAVNMYYNQSYVGGANTYYCYEVSPLSDEDLEKADYGFSIERKSNLEELEYFP